MRKVLGWIGLVSVFPAATGVIEGIDFYVDGYGFWAGVMAGAALGLSVEEFVTVVMAIIWRFVKMAGLI